MRTEEEIRQWIATFMEQVYRGLIRGVPEGSAVMMARAVADAAVPPGFATGVWQGTS